MKGFNNAFISTSFYGGRESHGIIGINHFLEKLLFYSFTKRDFSPEYRKFSTFSTELSTVIPQLEEEKKAFRNIFVIIRSFPVFLNMYTGDVHRRSVDNCS